MKKGELFIAITSIKLAGVLHLPGSILELGKELKTKDAERFVEHGAITRHFEEDDGMSIEDMAQVADLKSLKVQDLKSVCKHLGIQGYSNKKEDELISMIEKVRNPKDINLDELSEEELRELAKEEGVELSKDADIEAIRFILENELGE